MLNMEVENLLFVEETSLGPFSTSMLVAQRVDNGSLPHKLTVLKPQAKWNEHFFPAATYQRYSGSGHLVLKRPC